MITEIEPCPFCGKDAGMRYVINRAVIECNNRKCPVQPSTWLFVDTDSVSKLVESWNTRKGVVR